MQLKTRAKAHPTLSVFLINCFLNVYVKTIVFLIILFVAETLHGQSAAPEMLKQIKHATGPVMPASLTIYLVRHAEKPDEGAELSNEGRDRARDYATYLQNLTNPLGQTIRWDYLFAATESEESNRPVLTLQPLADAMGKTINSQFKNQHYGRLADYIQVNARRHFDHANVLICWHHGEILELTKALGVYWSDLPDSSHWPTHWPESVYGWLLKIYYNADGTLDRNHTEAVNEALRPDDTVLPSYGG